MINKIHNSYTNYTMDLAVGTVKVAAKAKRSKDFVALKAKAVKAKANNKKKKVKYNAVLRTTQVSGYVFIKSLAKLGELESPQ